MQSLHRRFVPIAIVALGALGACSGPEIDETTRQRVEVRGDSAAMTLIRALSGRLNHHMAMGGPDQAIRFCSEEAMPLTDSVSAELGAGWQVKRTTLQTRNPGNAPDSMEAEALRYFAAAPDSALPESFVQRTPAGDFRYYRPLRVGRVCLECHGDRSDLDPSVREVLDTRYPVDQATGYDEGDLRGLIRVTVPAEALR